MLLKNIVFAATAAVSFATASLAGSDHAIMVGDPYARVSSPNAKSGAAFMEIMNHAKVDDRLIDVHSDAAARVELHTHSADANGVMTMRQVKEGFVVPAEGHHMLQRGGDHVMLMGLTKPLHHGDVVDVTLVFEQAGEVLVQIPVDLERKPDHGAGEAGHEKHSH